MEIKLPEPSLKGKMSVEEAIQKRRSIRRYKNQPLTQKDLSQILWSAQGITDKNKKFRSAPSAGALYPMEIYVATQKGVFKYYCQNHSIIKIKDNDIRRELSSSAWGQRFIAEAGVVIIICAVYERVTSKYGNRGIMYVDMEAGHIAQNIHLQAVALNLGSVPVGAFDENEVKKLLGTKPDERPIYLIPVGYPEQ